MSLYVHSMLLLTFGSVLDAIPIDNGVEGDPEVECGPVTIAISFNTRNTFQGHVFVKGRFDEPGCRSDESGAEVAGIVLPFNSCGVSRIRSLNPKGIFISTTLIVAFHPQFLTKVDRAYKVQCFYMEADKTVSTAISVTDLTTAFASHNVPMPICRYEILESGPDGSQVTYAVIGMQVYHKWTCDSETMDTFCMRVHSCIAEDGKGQAVSILDEKGCAIDKYVLNDLDYPADLMAGQEAHVYKFADRSHLFFQCQISISIKEPGIDCSRPSCESLQRTRRAVDSLETLDVLSQTIETLDIAVHPNNLSHSYSFRISSICIEPLSMASSFCTLISTPKS
uniref:ZP domain-containing protein n=1 Tax=Ascaris lumbricoides TaxID=6252 RepID=A0A0M3HTR7_ASCLU